MVDIVPVTDDNFTVLSDAHIGANASSFKKDDVFLNQTIERCKGQRHVILNGDFLDVTLNLTDGKRHPRIGTEEGAALEKRMDILLPKLELLLARLAAESPGTQVHYMLGNHDGFERFQERMAELTSRHANLSVHDDMLRMGDVLFVHGDRDIPPCTREQVKAFRQERMLNKGASGPHEIEMYAQTYASIASRRAAQGDDAPISRVFLGHTHLGAQSIELPHIAISNGGVFRDDGVAYVFKGEFTASELSGLEVNRFVGPQAAIEF